MNLGRRNVKLKRIWLPKVVTGKNVGLKTVNRKYHSVIDAIFSVTKSESPIHFRLPVFSSLFFSGPNYYLVTSSQLPSILIMF